MKVGFADMPWVIAVRYELLKLRSKGVLDKACQIC
jgi:hypothetical protein